MILHLVGNDGPYEIPWSGRLLMFVKVPKVRKPEADFGPEVFPLPLNFETRNFRLVCIREDLEFAIYIED